MKKIISALGQLFKKSSPPKIIQGYVERIEHLEIHGWAIHRHHEPLTLQLRIHNTLYAVNPKWHERADVTSKLDYQDFLKVGFSITVRNAFLDAFLLARQRHDPIDVLANGVVLINCVEYPSAITDTPQLLPDIQEYDADYFNADDYLAFAKQHLASRNIDAARLLLKFAITISSHTETLELLANTYFEERNYEIALIYYQAAFINERNTGGELFSKLLHCKKLVTQPEEAIAFLVTHIKQNPEQSYVFQKHLDEAIADYWIKQQAVLEALAVISSGTELLEKMNAIAAFVYNIYLHGYGCNENPILVGSCNINRVLIVADFQTAESVSRLEQKILLFKAADINATAISWQNLHQEQQTLILHDIVIFYQLPAEPLVLKAMALVNTGGKLSFYGCDDLEFDSFNIAAKYCRVGIAATQALADALEPLVFDKRCFLHCDDLDSILINALAATQSPTQANRKKIALINVFFPPQALGGATRVVSDNFDILQRDYQKEFELCVFTSDAEHQTPHTLSLYNHQGARVYRSSIFWDERMDWFGFDDKMYNLFSEFLKLEQPDMVHFHCVQRLTASIVAAARDLQIPYLVTVHDAWWISDYQFLIDANHKIYPDGHPDPAQPCPPPAGISADESSTRILSLKALLHDAQTVLTVSESFAQLYRNNGIAQIQVNKNGLSDSIVWQTKETTYSPNVVCAHVGGMREHKGYFLFKAAVEKLQPRHVEVLIVDHDKDESYQHKTQWGDVPVRFIGRIKQANIVDLYKQLDVLFAPSTWPESYGLVTREAAACGCWVVASTMGGIGENVVEGQSGFLVNPNLKELTQCLKHIDEHPEQFKAVAQSTILRHVTTQVEELAVIYRKLIEAA